MLYKIVSEINIPGILKISHSIDVAMHDRHNEYFFNPMSLETIKEKISNKEYGSMESFLADFKWIQHNSHINKTFSRVYDIADELVKKVEEKCEEFEKCPDCVLNATKYNFWFIQPCDELHPIVFARRQDSVIWPGKAIELSQPDDSAK